MSDILTMSLTLMADSSGAVTAMRDYVGPTIRTLSALAAIVCTFFIVNSGFLYMTSSGRPDKMDHAKHVLRNALLGLVIVLAAATITSLLANAYGQPAGGQAASLPTLEAIPPQNVGNGLVEVLIKAVTGFLTGLSEETIDEFMRLIQHAVNSVLSGNKEQNDFSASTDNVYGGFTFVVAKDEDRMTRMMNFLAIKNKYLHKQDRWIALGANVNGGRLISGIQYFDGKWEQNDEMDRLLEIAKSRKSGKDSPRTLKHKNTKKRVKRKKRSSKRKKK